MDEMFIVDARENVSVLCHQVLQLLKVILFLLFL